MFLHCWSVRALRLRKAPRDALPRAILLIALSLLVATSSAHGAPGKRADKIEDVDTEHMFGFTEGSDIGEAGEKELEADSTGRFGRFGGSYSNVATTLEAKYSFSDKFRLSVDATVVPRARETEAPAPSPSNKRRKWLFLLYLALARDKRDTSLVPVEIFRTSCYLGFRR